MTNDTVMIWSIYTDTLRQFIILAYKQEFPCDLTVQRNVVLVLGSTLKLFSCIFGVILYVIFHQTFWRQPLC